MSKLFDIPAVSQSVDSAIRTPFNRMREAVQTLLGLLGDGQDAAITLRNAGSLVGGSTTIVIPGGGGGGGGTTPDLTPPPTLTGLGAVAGFTEVIVTWDAAVYTQGHGHGQTNIYAAKRNIGAALATFSDAQRVYAATGALTIAALPSELNTRWHIWAKWQTADGVESTAPAGGTNGVIVTTGQDITQLLAVLAGSITESQLFATLGARINLIDGSGAGSVNARIATEATTRASADTSLATSISTVSASNATNAAAIANETTARVSGDTVNASAITTVQSLVTNGSSAPFEAYQTWDFTATVDGWGATGATLTPGPEAVQVVSTGGDPIFRSPAIAVVGARYDKIRVRLRRLAGSGWDGSCFYSISGGHGESALFMKSLADPAAGINQWVIVEWDMANLSAGGADWTSHDITNVRLDFGTTSADQFEVDWVSIGRRGSPVSTASVQLEASTRATQTGALFAQYTVKLDVNGYVSGYGLASTSTGAAPTSSFIVRADSFAIASPSGPGISPATPFIVRTTVTTENGVSIPVGVYMDAAYIVNVSALYGRFGTLIAGSIAAGQINAANLTLGSGAVGGTLKSASWVSGTAGWLLQPGGYAEFNSIQVRGTVTGGAITSYSWPSAGSGPGFYLGPSGLLLGNYNDGKFFQVNSDGDIFAPNFSIVSGVATFAGNLNVKSATSGQRMETTNSYIKIFDSSGVKRVQLGDLSA